VPWNAPVALFIRSLAPALAAGNTVAAKLPGQTALSNALVADVVSKAPSLPDGIVNMFTESGNTGAPFLIESADVVSPAALRSAGRSRPLVPRR
jgi:betaine-aldehyde dehydrogenase